MKPFLFCLFFLPVHSFGQTEIRGRVVCLDDNSPVAFASIGVKNKEAGCVADSKGYFKLHLPGFIKSSDSVLVSSIGYQQAGYIVSEVKRMDELGVKYIFRTLNNVFVKSNFREQIVGTSTDNSFLFFRTWVKGTGGEIGQVMDMPNSQFMINRIQTKIDNKNDTCWVRLHVRKVTPMGEPGEELLRENIVKAIYQTTSEDVINFELGNLELDVPNKKIFIGFEVLSCRSKDQLPHSICFVGSEYGQHNFKYYANSLWNQDPVFSIHIKMILREKQSLGGAE